MLVALLKVWIINLIKRRIRKAMFKKLFSVQRARVLSVLALIVGGVASVLGVDIAPEQVDVLVTSVASIVAVVVEIVERRRKASEKTV